MASDEYLDDYYDPRRIPAVRIMHSYAGDCDVDGRRMSRLSIESMEGDDDDADADAELSDEGKEPKHGPEDDDDDESDKDVAAAGGTASLPCTPDHRRRLGRSVWDKEYASDAEARGRRPGKGKERCLDQAWEIKKCRAAAAAAVTEVPDAECRVLVRPRGRDWSMPMDMDEVKACRDLGLELPCDWTVEIPYCFSGDTSSGGNSPVSSRRISSPGDDPKDVKARLKAWAQAVALASASRFSG